MSDYQRDLDDLVDATQFVTMYSEKLKSLAVDTITNGPYATHEHAVAAKSTLILYSEKIGAILKTPAAGHEFRVLELADDIRQSLRQKDFQEEYVETMTAKQVCYVVAHHILKDVQAVSDFLTLRRLEEGLR